MSLIQQGLHKMQDGAGVLELRAEADHSLRVTRIRECGPCEALRYIELTIDRKSVGYFRCAYPDATNYSATDIGMNQELLAYDQAAQYRRNAINIFDWMKEYGVPITYPVAQGQTFRIEVIADSLVDVEYDLFEAGDVVDTEINGLHSPEFLYIERGTNALVSAIGDPNVEVDLSITPAQFPDFPFEGVASANSTFTLYGIVGQPVAISDGGVFNAASERLQLIKDREVLLDPDRLGLMFRGNRVFAGAGFMNIRECSVIGHNMNPNDRILMFDPPIVFEPGSELNVFVTWGAVVAATNVPVHVIDVGFILKETRSK